MNLAQILRLALYEADAVNVDGTTHRFVTETELLAWAQEGHALLFGKLRQANQDYGLVTRTSTDADFRWHGITYDPSSFGLTTTARTYTLPPDLLELRSIRATTSGEEGRVFTFKDLSDPAVLSQARVDSSTTNAGIIYYDLVGERTLRLPQPPDTALDIELSYIAEPSRLFLYSTGTVSITQNTDDLVGVSSQWVIEELTTPCEFMAATGATAPKIVSQTSSDPFVDPSALYSPVSTIDSDTTLTLAGNWLKATVSGKAYLLASAPSVPHAWRWVLTRWLTAMIRWKASGSPPSERPDFEAIMAKDMLPVVAQRQTADFTYVEDYDPE